MYMEQKIELNIEKKFYNTKGKINRIKKMDKKIILQIQLIIQDIMLNGEIVNEELQIPESRNEIKDVVLEMLRGLIDKKGDFQILKEYEEEIDRHLILSIKEISPIYTEDQINELTEIIGVLKQIPQPEQRTPEWYVFRQDRLTASDLGTILGLNPYEKYNGIVQKKAGLEKPFKTNRAIMWGVKYEEVITKIYELRNRVKVYEYGCLPHPTVKHFGASPDGIVDVGSENVNYIGRMLEIKCPSSRDITGFIPEYYHAQVQGQLEVCDLEYCDFVECKISEYETKEEYFTDGDLCYQANGFEKGVVIDTYDKELGKEVFYYLDIGLTKEEIDKFEDEILDKVCMNDNLEYLKTSYWKVTEYNELLIKRDKEKFHNQWLPIINEFWEKVLYYRQRPMEEVKALCGKKKIINKEKEKKPNGLNEVVKLEDKNLITNYIESEKKQTAETTNLLFLSDSDSD